MPFSHFFTVVDKPGITTLQQLSEVRKVQKETSRIYSINTERLESRSIVKAGELGWGQWKIIQTIGLGPHQMKPGSRPEWFFTDACIEIRKTINIAGRPGGNHLFLVD